MSPSAGLRGTTGCHSLWLPSCPNLNLGDDLMQQVLLVCYSRFIFDLSIVIKEVVEDVFDVYSKVRTGNT